MHGIKNPEFSWNKTKEIVKKFSQWRVEPKSTTLGVGKKKESYGFDNSNWIYVNKGTEVK